MGAELGPLPIFHDTTNFLYSGVVQGRHWLNEHRFVDAVAVAMITPGPWSSQLRLSAPFVTENGSPSG